MENIKINFDNAFHRKSPGREDISNHRTLTEITLTLSCVMLKNDQTYLKFY